MRVALFYYRPFVIGDKSLTNTLGFTHVRCFLRIELFDGANPDIEMLTASQRCVLCGRQLLHNGGPNVDLPHYGSHENKVWAPSASIPRSQCECPLHHSNAKDMQSLQVINWSCPRSQLHRFRKPLYLSFRSLFNPMTTSFILTDNGNEKVAHSY